MLQMRFIHRCIPYCRPDDGEHTQLVYTDNTETSATIQRTIGIRFGLSVFRAAEEPDARPEVDTSGRKPYPKAWLVTWQSKRTAVP
jgi:hypothetical protein